MKRKPKGLYLEEHLNWKDLPEDVKEFLVQTEIADNKRHKEIWKGQKFCNRLINIQVNRCHMLIKVS